MCQTEYGAVDLFVCSISSVSLCLSASLSLALKMSDSPADQLTQLSVLMHYKGRCPIHIGVTQSYTETNRQTDTETQTGTTTGRQTDKQKGR